MDQDIFPVLFQAMGNFSQSCVCVCAEESETDSLSERHCDVQERLAPQTDGKEVHFLQNHDAVWKQIL